MPNVPRRQPDQVQLGGLPSVRGTVDTPAGAFGGGPAQEAAARASSGLSRSVSDVIIEQKKQADQAAVIDFDAKLTAIETGLLYDKNAGAMNKKSKDALAVYQPTKDQYDKESAELMKGLSSSVQRAKAAELSGARWAAIDRSLQNHMATQSKAYAVEIGMAKVQSSTALAVAAKTDLTEIDGLTTTQRQLLAIDEAIQLTGSAQGIPQEAINILQKKAHSDVHEQIINQFLSENNPKSAEAYLKANGGGIESKDLAGLQKAVSGAVLEDQVLKISSSAVSSPTAKNPDGTVDLTKAIGDATADAVKLGYDEKGILAAQNATRQRAAMADAQLKDNRDTSDRAFFNESIALRDSGKSFDEAYEQVKKYGYDALDLLQKRQQLFALYQKDESFYDDAEAKMTKAQAAVFDDIKKQALKAYGSDTVTLPGEEYERKKYDVFVAEMRQQLIGKAPEQMRQIAEKAMGEVVVVPGMTWKGFKIPLTETTGPAFQRDYQMRIEASKKRLAQATEAARIRKGRAPTDAEVQALLNSPKAPR